MHRSTESFRRPNRLALLLATGILLVGIGLSQAGENAATLEVPAAYAPLHVAAPLPKGTPAQPGSLWKLVEVGQPDSSIDAQVVSAIAADGTKVEGPGKLCANIPPRSGASGTRRFLIQPAKAAAGKITGALFEFRDLSDKSIELRDGDRPVFVYNHGVIVDPKVPEADGRGSRAGYMHPVYGLSGEVLTDDFPKDHYHHHGIFWTWPHIQIDGKQYDLWMGKDIKSRFVRWIAKEAGPVTAVLAVENGWFVGDKQVMVERVWMQAWRAADGTRSIDLQLALVPTDQPVTLWGAEGKSYGGLTIRFAVKDEKKTRITVPSGLTKQDLPETRLPWADLTYTFANMTNPSGAALMVAPDHPDFPPTWLTRHYGPLCIGWPGVKPQTLQPGKPVRLDYRTWIHKGEVDSAKVGQAFDAYQAGRKAAIQ